MATATTPNKQTKLCQWQIINLHGVINKNKILRRIFGPKRDEMGNGEGSTMRNFIV
jgi:hypothetical protein